MRLRVSRRSATRAAVLVGWDLVIGVTISDSVESLV